MCGRRAQIYQEGDGTAVKISPLRVTFLEEGLLHLLPWQEEGK